MKRTQRLKLARDAEIAKSIARGDELDDIALRVGYHAHGTGRYPSIAIRKRMEAMGLHQKRKRLKVKRISTGRASILMIRKLMRALLRARRASISPQGLTCRSCM